jgi:hypothetical protein
MPYALPLKPDRPFADRPFWGGGSEETEREEANKLGYATRVPCLWACVEMPTATC